MIYVSSSQGHAHLQVWFLLLVAAPSVIHAVFHPESPCPTVFNYEGVEPEFDRWYGEVRMASNENLVGVVLNIKFDRVTHLLVSWTGEVSSEDNILYTVINLTEKLSPKSPIHSRFMVKYNGTRGSPRIKTIRLNGRQICPPEVNIVNELQQKPKVTTDKNHRVVTKRPDPVFPDTYTTSYYQDFMTPTTHKRPRTTEKYTETDDIIYSSNGNVKPQYQPASSGGNKPQTGDDSNYYSNSGSNKKPSSSGDSDYYSNSNKKPPSNSNSKPTSTNTNYNNYDNSYSNTGSSHVVRPSNTNQNTETDSYNRPEPDRYTPPKNPVYEMPSSNNNHNKPSSTNYNSNKDENVYTGSANHAGSSSGSKNTNYNNPSSNNYNPQTGGNIQSIPRPTNTNKNTGNNNYNNYNEESTYMNTGSGSQPSNYDIDDKPSYSNPSAGNNNGGSYNQPSGSSGASRPPHVDHSVSSSSSSHTYSGSGTQATHQEDNRKPSNGNSNNYNGANSNTNGYNNGESSNTNINAFSSGTNGNSNYNGGGSNSNGYNPGTNNNGGYNNGANSNGFNNGNGGGGGGSNPNSNNNNNNYESGGSQPYRPTPNVNSNNYPFSNNPANVDKGSNLGGINLQPAKSDKTVIITEIHKNTYILPAKKKEEEELSFNSNAHENNYDIGVDENLPTTPKYNQFESNNNKPSGNSKPSNQNSNKPSGGTSSGGKKPSQTSKPQPNANREETCGIVSVQGTTLATPLVTNGQATARGQWPWHVALYKTDGINLTYICGGSLITRNIVVTAAHCVTRKPNDRPVDVNTIVIYLGKYHLQQYSDDGGIQIKQVLDITPYSTYNSSNYLGDIALLKMTSSAEYTSFVRPVCLWDPRGTELTSVIDKDGTVIGWGYDEHDKASEELKMAKMPVVSQETCIYSNRPFFSQFTSNKTFCAGFRNGTSVCNGDSGGGMVFPRGSSWHLRGIVSISVAQSGLRKCDTKHYVVFTDVAKYLDWIKNYVQKHSS